MNLFSVPSSLRPSLSSFHTDDAAEGDLRERLGAGHEGKGDEGGRQAAQHHLRRGREANIKKNKNRKVRWKHNITCGAGGKQISKRIGIEK